MRVLGGIGAPPLGIVYSYLMPLMVLLTWILLTLVFVLNLYGGSGEAEVFGRDGLFDYLSLFLVGVASDALTKGLHTIQLRPTRA